MTEPLPPCLGLDLGSVFTKAVLVGEDGRVETSLYRRRDREDGLALAAFLDEADGRLPGSGVHLGVTGLSATASRDGRGGGDGRFLETSPLVAVAAGVSRLSPSALGIIEIGGHTSKFLVLREGTGERAAAGEPMALPDGDVRAFATNEACAAGTGSFLEQQARRLGLDAASLSELAAGAARGVPVAGRCSVFAASDMIHLQQKGTPLSEIAYGLCLAIARNALTALLKGREVPLPVVIAGGCARNRGILRAFREVLGVGDDRLVLVSEEPGLEAALGAAVRAREAPAIDLAEVRVRLASLLSSAGAPFRRLPRLRRAEAPVVVGEPGTAGPPLPGDRVDGYLGIDVGSVSTDVVALDRQGDVLASVYLPTRGRPADALREGLAAVEARFAGRLHVLACGTTGSGRHLAGRLVRADVVRNEITCQLLGARRYVPDVDTIFEIGGQDSKFIAVKDGGIADFAMNKLCAAGTGSFLEEESKGLDLDVCRDFSDRAFAAAEPLELGSRCTVFMETEVVSALARGAPVEEVCAGLAYAIARNYLDKVVGGRRLGRRIVFQGGVASNAAVVAAFESLLGCRLHVHPFNRISGAIGAALAARSAREAGAASESRFLGFGRVESPTLRSFECRQCANRCEVNVLEMGPGRKERAYFGDTCERYTSGAPSPNAAAARTAEPTPRPPGGAGGGAPPPNATDGRLPNLAEEYRRRCEALFTAGEGEAGEGLRVGIPRASSLMGALPFWATFWKELGHRPVLSAATSPETLSLGLKHLSVGVCLPIKLTAGHVRSLLSDGVDRVFVPAVVKLPGEEPTRSYACPYTMAVPYLMGRETDARTFSPVVSFESEEAFAAGFETFLEELGTSRGRVREAFRAAMFVQEELHALFAGLSRDLLGKGGFRRAFAILGRPYLLFDGYVNLGLFERLRRMEVLAIPHVFLPIGDGTESAARGAGGQAPSTLPWRFPADMHEAARELATIDAGGRLHPVVLSCFACGPDAFALRQIDEALAGRGHLLLELDEHRGEAGLVTRVEAFLDQLDLEGRASERAVPAARPAAAGSPASPDAFGYLPDAPATVWIPYFADHAYAFSGVFRFKGHDARVLPPPGPDVRAMGERYALGKECHAFSMIAGDLLTLATRKREEDVVFYFPGTSLPCLLHEYGRGMQALLRELGLTGVTVSSPPAARIVAAFGIDAAERLYLGLLAIELLVKAVCQTRPYEREKGSVDRVHQRNLERIEAAVAAGDVVAALDESLRELAAVPVGHGRRPLVGLAGDVYTKANSVANVDLVRWLEEQGLEVWPSPFQIDLVDYGISRRLHRSMAALDLPGLLESGAVALRRAVDVFRVRSVVGWRVAWREEAGQPGRTAKAPRGGGTPGYLETRRLAEPYMSCEENELLLLNVARIVEFARGGVDGIVNAICFGCMVGNASAAVIERIRRDFDDVPILTAVYAGSEDPSRRMGLEAFVAQVKAHQRRRLAVRAGPRESLRSVLATVLSR